MWHDIKALHAAANALFGLLALMLLSAGLWWVTQRPMFALKAIRIEGMDAFGAPTPLRHIDPSIVRATALPRIQGNFFTIDLDAARAAFETVPWVRKASVRRTWPNQLSVGLEEHMPLGTWSDDGRLLSVKGEVFTANLAEAEEDTELADFGGPDGSEKEIAAYFRTLQQWFAPAQLLPRGVRLSTRYAWSVRLNNGTTVELGREQDQIGLRARVERFVQVYPRLRQLSGRIERVDLRYPNGLALQTSGWVPITDLAGQEQALKTK